jgi:HEAT repeat protein
MSQRLPLLFTGELRRIVRGLDKNHRASAGADVKALRAGGVHSAAGLLRTLLPDGDEAMVVRACWFVPRIHGIGSSVAVRRLSVLLTSPSRAVRGAAARALGEFGSKSAVRSLLVAIRDTDAQVRLAVVYALGKIGDPRAREVLVGIVRDSRESAKLRGLAAESLGLLGDLRSVPALIVALGAQSPQVRLFAAFALGELRDRRALRALRRAQADGGRVRGYGTVRREARAAIDSIERRPKEGGKPPRKRSKLTRMAWTACRLLK